MQARAEVPSIAALALVLTLQLACGGSGGQPSSTGQSPEALWLRANAVPLSQVDPEASLDDLEPLRQMVGDARVVALGEATHGTSEFFRMKHRILRFLVERMGFSAFAIEASWPEANRVDAYVRTGEGDPAVLLSGLYFWTWNTSEVLDMIRWIRRHDSAGGSVGFYGFDMQFPGMAIDNVSRFVEAADGRAAAEFTEHLDCLAPFANDASGRFSREYGPQPQAYRDGCLADLHWVEDTLLAKRQPYTARTSEAEWARAARSARVAIQYEQMASNRVTRDASMADNASWLLDQLGPQGRIVLWAHNYHVSTYSGSMGSVLRPKLGTQLFILGFDFARGSFTAVKQSGSTYQGLATVTADEPKPSSYEEYFSSAGLPEFLLDLRGRALDTPDSSWLAGPRSSRSLNIGCCYDASLASGYWQPLQLPQLFDAVVFFENSTPSAVLPFRYPATF